MGLIDKQKYVFISRSLGRQVMKTFITTKPVGQRTGLGLSICNDIVNVHSGVINIDSRQDGHTKFLIDLPVASEKTNE